MSARLPLPQARPRASDCAVDRLALPGRLLLRPSTGKGAEDGSRPDYFLFQPEDVDPARPPLVAVHGISRNAETHLEAFASVAAAQRRLLIAPHFDEERFNGFQRLAGGTEDSVAALWRDVAEVSGLPCTKFDMVGFSGGAQFTHRYGMLHPGRVSSMTLVAAGWYTFPSETERFPYGIARANRRGRRCAENLRDFLAIPTLVLVGAEDRQRDESLRKTLDVDIRQGLNRIERASRWSCAFLQAATRAGVAPTLQFAMLPDCGHGFEDCVGKGGLAGLVEHWLQRGSAL
ncbi:MAG: hypothetical protein Tsb0032_26440 [Kiloniellaceae bacterium]